MERVRIRQRGDDTPLPITSSEDLELVQRLQVLEARESFWAFRQYMHPDLIKGWWQRLVAYELQQFYVDMKHNLRPVLVLSAPPQHGKSYQVHDFISWVAGREPDWATIFASYSEDLGDKANTFLQRNMDTEKYLRVFPGTQLAHTRAGFAPASRTGSFLEWVGKKGSFRNTTVEGQVTGQGLDLGLIDDPLKGRAEASSKKIRDRVWDWLTDDFFTRFSEYAGLLMIMTRWHVDDPAGRFKTRFPQTRILRYPAIAEHDEDYRMKGEPLFPEHKSREFLMQHKTAMTKGGWESVYQQNPIIVGGDLFPVDKFEVRPQVPDPKEVKMTVRYWDKAGTEDGGAYTAGVRMHEMKDGNFVVSDVSRGQWSALERERRIKQCAEIDRAEYGFRVRTWVEQEPGSGGKESAERTISMLRGFTVRADKVTGSKEIRAEPYAAQVQAGNVSIVASSWNRPFLEEHEEFPSGKYKDQVDAAGGAFAKLTNKGTSSYDSSLSWV